MLSHGILNFSHAVVWLGPIVKVLLTTNPYTSSKGSASSWEVRQVRYSSGGERYIGDSGRTLKTEICSEEGQG